jgi:hypothetical protein
MDQIYSGKRKNETLDKAFIELLVFLQMCMEHLLVKNFENIVMLSEGSQFTGNSQVCMIVGNLCRMLFNLEQ